MLLRGPGVMAGYHNTPDATAEALDADGWLHTGDIGELDERGFLKITDRKKDLFKTSGGKYVAPSIIEAKFKGICPYVSQFVVHGDGRNYVTALITLDPDAITGWAAQQRHGRQEYAEIVTSDARREMVQGYVDKLNAASTGGRRSRSSPSSTATSPSRTASSRPSLKLQAQGRLATSTRTCWTRTTPADAGDRATTPGGSVTRGTKRYHPCSSTDRPALA